MTAPLVPLDAERAFREAVAARLELAMQEAGLETYQELADRVGCSRVHVFRILTGRQIPSLLLARRIAIATGFSVDRLCYLGECINCGDTVDEEDRNAHRCAKRS